MACRPELKVCFGCLKQFHEKTQNIVITAPNGNALIAVYVGAWLKKKH